MATGDPICSICNAQAVLHVLQQTSVGRQNATKADMLAGILGMTWRQVEHAVEELRNSGVFIASARTGDRRGLYLPATEQEWRDALGSFRRATITQLRTFNAMKRAKWKIAEALNGQATLF